MKKTTTKMQAFIAMIGMAFLIGITLPAGAITTEQSSDIQISVTDSPVKGLAEDLKCGGEKKEEKTTSGTVSQGSESTQSGKCGEGKCGEGKCGEAKTTAKEKEGKEAESKSVSSEQKAKTSQGKCGEGKCGEGKCGTDRF